MLSTLLAVLLLAAEPQGRLCIGDDCSAATTATIAVKPADQERRFFWISDDAKTAYAGVIPAKADAIVLDPEAFSALDVTIDGDASRGWPLDVAVTLMQSPTQQWKWKLDRDAAKRLRRLYVPRGTYRLVAKAEHHSTLPQRVSAGAEPSNLDLRFVPLPLARGVVVDVEDKPIAAATVSLPDGAPCATANEQGEFTCELPERIPETLVVSSGGYASRELEIAPENIGRGVDFGRVRLSAGRTLTLKVAQPEAKASRVTLFLDGARYNHAQLETHAIKEREETVRFDVGEGQYLVVVEGDSPLERLEVPVEVKAADVEHEIRVEPFEVIGNVRFGDDPLAEGYIEIIAPEHTWRHRLPIAGGAFRATMWQHGSVTAFVTAPTLGGNELIRSPKLGEDPSRWDIRIEKRMISGRVLDAATKAPITAGDISVSFEADRSKGYFGADIKPDGSYQILASRPGTYQLRLNDPRYMPSLTEVVITQEDRSRTVDIALESGVLQPIDLVSADGSRLAGASVLEGVQSDRVNPQFMSRADERGHYELRGKPGETRVLYVIPHRGSFAVVRVQLPRTSADAKPLQIVVPAPSAALRVRTVDDEGKPLPTRILIRYNGEFVPGAIFRFVTGEMDTGETAERVFPRLPPGAYEVWALAGPDDEVQLIGSAGALREPVRVGLSNGEQAVTVIAPRRPRR